MPQMAMGMSFSGHLPTEVIGTLSSSKQLEGLVTLGMYGSHKHSASILSRLDRGFFYADDPAEQGRARQVGLLLADRRKALQ